MSTQHSMRSSLVIALCLIISSLCVACTDQGPESKSVSQGEPLIVLNDPSPAQLEILVDVTMGGYDVTSHDLTSIDLIFTSKGHLVQFGVTSTLFVTEKISRCMVNQWNVRY